MFFKHEKMMVRTTERNEVAYKFPTGGKFVSHERRWIAARAKLPIMLAVKSMFSTEWDF